MEPAKKPRKTPLNAWHRNAGARMIDFAGWDMPVYYTGILEEHLAVRQKAGLFDISHMGRFEAKGPGAKTLLQSLFTNNLDKLTTGRALYGLFCDEKGGVIDDLIIYQLGESDYYICVNAVNRDVDFKWLKEHANGSTALNDLSDGSAQFAVQGPLASAIVGDVLGPAATGLKYFGCAKVEWKGESTLVTRTGYTGEDGYELYLPEGAAEPLWEALLKAGKPQGLAPIGLGARDSLRIEMGYPLYGHEISREIGPIEAGLLRFVDLKKESFVGKQAIQKKAEKPPAKLCGVALKKDGMIRDHYEVATGSPSTAIGWITSGCFSPVLKRSIGLALLTAEPQGGEVRIRIRAKEIEAEITKVPFVTPGTKRS